MYTLKIDKRFSKQLEKYDIKLQSRIKDVLKDLKWRESMRWVNEVKWITGYKWYYRIRIWDVRIWFFEDEDILYRK
jgi:mRNA-degrading endonuclease RelE of RelBE toxin-antitoxin system